MRFRIVMSCLVSGLLAFSVSTGWAGGRVVGKRANLYQTSCHGGADNGAPCTVLDKPYICQGGSSDGEICDPKQRDCGEGKCVVNKDECFHAEDKTPGQCMIDFADIKPIKGVLTIMVDDTATNWRSHEEENPDDPNDPNNPPDGPPTATILLEVKNKGETILFTDSYIECCVSESQAAGWANLVDEAGLTKLHDPTDNGPQGNLRGFPLQNTNSLEASILKEFDLVSVSPPVIPVISKATSNPDKVKITKFPEIPRVGAAARLNVEIRFAIKDSVP